MLHPDSLNGISWSSKVYMTRNFILTTASVQRASHISLTAVAGNSGMGSVYGCLNEYLRPISSVLLFPSGDVLLLSERECEGVLEQLWGFATNGRSASSAAPGSKSAAQLLCLSYARLARTAAAGNSSSSGSSAQAPGVQFLALPVEEGVLTNQAIDSADSRPNPQIPAVSELVCMHLFDGGAMFDGDVQQLSHLKGMVRGKREVAEALLGMRGKQTMFPRSQLELACDVE